MTREKIRWQGKGQGQEERATTLCHLEMDLIVHRLSRFLTLLTIGKVIEFMLSQTLVFDKSEIFVRRPN
jgi:hypothetical protein